MNINWNLDAMARAAKQRLVIVGGPGSVRAGVGTGAAGSPPSRNRESRLGGQEARKECLRRIHLTLLSVIVLSLYGCRSEMYDQARYEPYEPTEFFADGTSARPIIAGTVAHRADRPEGNASIIRFETGLEAGKPAERFPMPVDRALLDRGQERFRIFCTPCHGELGDGKGIVVARGFNPPPTYHSEALRRQPPGHFVDVMTRGFGTMYSYAARVPPADRWAIAAYIKALQLSQNAPVRDLPAEDLDQLPRPRP